MGRRLKKRGVVLDIIVCSDARRAMDTAAAVAKILSLPPKTIRPTAELYHARPERIAEAVYAFPDKWHQAMIVGHNPGFTELANWFYPHPIANIPTAGVVVLRFNVSSWRQIHRENLDFSTFDYPKNR